MNIALSHAPIDEVVVGAVWDRAEGPDAVDAGRYLTERADRFIRHELHEPLGAESRVFTGPSPARVWLVSADDAWIVQLQADRFHANWRRKGSAAYPGFSRGGGAMWFALEELEKLQEYCARTRGIHLRPIGLELSKVDLLIQGKHWSDAADAASLLPVLSGIQAHMKSPGVNVNLQWRERLAEGDDLLISVTSVRMKSLENPLAYRVDFKVSTTAVEDARQSLLRMNQLLNEAFVRLVPAAQHERFR